MILSLRFLPYLVPIRGTDIQQQSPAREFIDRNGLPLGTILSYDQNHTAVITLAKVSPEFLKAILAVEDADFYQHGPVDLKAIARALIQAVQAKQIVSGASTITMQLARLLKPAPRNLQSKLTEIWTAWRLGAGMTKDEILEAYVNRLPMGGNIYGVEAAARTYFGIAAAELNLAQGTLLAAIPNNPNGLNPYTHWRELKQRQQYILKRMVKEGYISEETALHTEAEMVSLQSRREGIIAAPHFLFWLYKSVPTKEFQVQTTLERPLQEFVETQVREVVKNLASHNVHQAAALVLDNHTGEVLAYVGSTDYFAQASLGQNDGVQALRQPGSTLKPFLYQLALEKRLISPNTILADVPTHYAIPGAKIYSPTDYNETFQGPVRVRIALANSLNIPAVRVLEKVGVSEFLTRLRQLGFTHLNQDAEYYGLGLSLGSGEVTLWELAQAYRILANQGQVSPLITLKSLNPVSSQKISPADTWQFTTDVLSDRYARAKSFGVKSVLNLPFPAAVKTGTSSIFVILGQWDLPPIIR